LLGSGTFQNVPVSLDTPINQSTSLTAVIHRDTNSNGRFDYVSSNGTQDRPLTPQGDRRIVDIAQVTIQNNSDSGGTTISGNNGGIDANSGTQTAFGGDGDTTDTARDGEGRQQGTEVGGPGFGLVVGVVALLTVALLAVRRT
jgi:PGF-CTERM protein